ncbi:hypothetical protein [Porphyrobacter sp. AAP60]|uniref:hypothetical protein n=1 Tax=Porphyrobacter sp. AAP60 TaxID=1523423 RepID=UPI0006B9B1AF|nr:hypothetical protein [Porphyrobacter sp. AAP60]
MPKSTKPRRGRASSTCRSLVPSNRPSTAIALPQRLTLGDHEIHPEQILNISERRPYGEGPWKDEPDRVAWTDAATGYACLILRQKDGTLAGYVAIGSSHPLWGYEHDAIPPELGIRPHEGIDYAALCNQNGPPALQICHVRHVTRVQQSAPMASDSDAAGSPDAWWFGFTCDKDGDLLPKGNFRNDKNREVGPRVYRDIGYVADQVVHLADKLWALDDQAPGIDGEGAPDRGVPLTLHSKSKALLPRKGGSHEA